MRQSAPARFRELLAKDSLLVLPGVYDALSARVVERAGFASIYMSGFSVATSSLGRPDLGMLGSSEMAEQARRITAAVEVPVLADADTGYGGPFSIKRTVEEYERAGLAGLHIEDQDLEAKRCGWLGDIKVVETKAMVQRIRAALNARRNEDFFIIARTDARKTLGFEEALQRAQIYAAEGADAVFVEYLTDIAEVRKTVEAVDLPTVQVLIQGESSLTPADLEGAGVSIVLYPIAMLQAALAAGTKVAGELLSGKAVEDLANNDEIRAVIKYEEMSQWQNATEVRRE